MGRVPSSTCVVAQTHLDQEDSFVSPICLSVDYGDVEIIFPMLYQKELLLDESYLLGNCISLYGAFLVYNKH